MYPRHQFGVAGGDVEEKLQSGERHVQGGRRVAVFKQVQLE
jgi:hypothetical protein